MPGRELIGSDLVDCRSLHRRPSLLPRLHLRLEESSERRLRRVLTREELVDLASVRRAEVDLGPLLLDPGPVRFELLHQRAEVACRFRVLGALCKTLQGHDHGKCELGEGDRLGERSEVVEEQKRRFLRDTVDVDASALVLLRRAEVVLPIEGLEVRRLRVALQVGRLERFDKVGRERDEGAGTLRKSEKEPDAVKAQGVVA